MIRIITAILIVLYLPTHAFFSKIDNVSIETFQQMSGKSWFKGCPVNAQDLHHVRVNYYDFNNKVQTGDLIVHKHVSKDVVGIFKALFEIAYPIQSLKRYSDLDPNQITEINNTVGFYCKTPPIHAGNVSKHAYGLAIDINPKQNPSTKLKSDPTTTHEKITATKINTDSKIFKIFTSFGWRWGGFDKKSDKMHFEKIYDAYYAVDSMHYLDPHEKIEGLQP